MTREAAALMETAARSSTSRSIEGLQPAFDHSHYAASKAAVIMHTRAAALELGRRGRPRQLRLPRPRSTSRAGSITSGRAASSAGTPRPRCTGSAGRTTSPTPSSSSPPTPPAGSRARTSSSTAACSRTTRGSGMRHGGTARDRGAVARVVPTRPQPPPAAAHAANDLCVDSTQIAPPSRASARARSNAHENGALC